MRVQASAQLVFDDLVCGYGDTVVVRKLSGSVTQGGVLGVLGRNGVGKTTLLRALAGFLPLLGGRVTWNGHDLAQFAPHKRLAAGMAYAPQENIVFADLSVAENLWLHLPNEKRNGNTNGNRNGNRERYAACLEQFPRIAERMQQRAGSLSGGERKLLSFTRTLGLAAPLTLFDEPTEGVQPENIDRMALLIESRRAAGAAFIVVEQNLAFLATIADQVLVLDHGECVARGSMKDFDRKTLESYLVV